MSRGLGRLQRRILDALEPAQHQWCGRPGRHEGACIPEYCYGWLTLHHLKYPRVSYTDLDDLICKSEQPLSPNTLCVEREGRMPRDGIEHPHS